MELEYKNKFKSGTMAFKEGNYQLAFGYYREVLKYIVNNDEECLMLIEKSKEHLENYINDNEL